MDILALIDKFNIYLLIPLFMLCYFSLAKLNVRMKKKTFEKSLGEVKKKPAGNIRKLHEKPGLIHIFKKTDEKLYKQGYPLGLNGYSYYVVKILLFVFCYLSGQQNYDSTVMAVTLGLLGFFILDIYISISKRIRDNSINNDLLNIVDCLCLQMSANMSLQDALRGLHEVCDNQDLKKALIKLAAEYELSGNNIEDATKEFNDAFDILEINLFTSALKQQVVNGDSQETLGNLSEILKEGYMDRLNLKTKMKNLYIIAGVVVIMIDIIALTMFPIFVDVGQGIRKIFE